MCGIVGGASLRPIEQFILDGLQFLEYRGYDSAGIALVDPDEKKIYLRKTVGKVQELKSLVKQSSHPDALVGIGHTRWATHGAPSEINAHPQLSEHQEFAVVHNGVIDNYSELKNKLIKAGYNFKSETDTEVIADLLEFFYQENKDIVTSLHLLFQSLSGSFALAIVHQGDSQHVYFMRNRTPLIIGKSANGMYLASDYIPMLKVANEFIELNNGDFGELSATDIRLFSMFDYPNQKKNIIYQSSDLKQDDYDLKGYPNYMLKEIEEGVRIVPELVSIYAPQGKFKFDPVLLEQLKTAEELIILASGTSYHAGLIGANYLADAGIKTHIYLASEWAFYPKVESQHPVYMVISQSGETADVIHCLDIIQKRPAPVIGLVNVAGSSIAHRSNYVLLAHAGPEVAIVSTKAYVAQVAILALLKKALLADTNLTDFVALIDAQKKVMLLKEKIEKIAGTIAPKHDVYFIGRGIDYALAQEASLKLKEISYIHSEAFAGGELKHGPIALIEKDTPVIGFISDQKSAASMRNNLEEALSRGARTIVITSKSLSLPSDDLVVDDVPLYLSPLVKVIVAQYLAYFTTLKLGYDVDKPRNLAKSVTVE